MAHAGIKIVSGGQTGADRAALDWAIRHGLEHNGWCPLGRRAEDGVIDPRYQLRETSSADYAQRTEWNVRDSDATVILSTKPVVSGGTGRTLEFAQEHRKPCLVLSRSVSGQNAASLLHRFVDRHQARVLNVAGPRQSEEPDIGAFVEAVLDEWWNLLSRSAGGTNQE